MSAARHDRHSAQAGGDAPRASTILGAAGARTVSPPAAPCCVPPIRLTVVGLGRARLTFLGLFVVWRGPIPLTAAIGPARPWRQRWGR